MRLGLLALVALLAMGCTASFEETRARQALDVKLGAAAPVRDDAHCASLDSDHRFFTYAAWTDGSLAGASGAVAGALAGHVDKGVTIGLGAASAGFAALTVYAAAREASTANEWAAQCSGPPAPVQASDGEKIEQALRELRQLEQETAVTQ